jgi:hypothetical protein
MEIMGNAISPAIKSYPEEQKEGVRVSKNQL